MNEKQLKGYIKEFESDIIKGTLQVIDNVGEIDESVILLLYDPVTGSIEVSNIATDQIAGVDYLDFYQAVNLYVCSQVSERSELVHLAWVSRANIYEEDEKIPEGQEPTGIMIYFESDKDFSVYGYRIVEKGLKVDITGEMIDHYQFELVDEKRMLVNKGLGIVSEPGVFKQL